jgi:hypothetical protein
MFDYAPVGGVTALAGLCFVALLGWRLVPQRDRRGAAAELFDIEPYLAELIVPEDSALDGKKVAELHELADDVEWQVTGLAPRRDSYRRSSAGRGRTERSGEAGCEPGGEAGGGRRQQIRSAHRRRCPGDRGVGSPGFRRGGAHVRTAPLRQPFRYHVLLLHGDAEKLADTLGTLGLLPLADRGLSFGLRSKGPALIAIFAVAIALASTGILPIYVALGLALVAMVLANLMPLRGIYEGVDWPVIVLLGALIPVGGALQTTGATHVVAEAILGLASTWSPVVVLGMILIVTMTLSDLVNNAATAIVMGPIAVTIAERLGSNPDAFLMAVAVGASCAFLTPIGHQNNALIMGPAGYRFGDYWRLGLPLEILIVTVSLPAIVLFWGI